MKLLLIEPLTNLIYYLSISLYNLKKQILKNIQYNKK
jgi:hypothetical protein